MKTLVLGGVKSGKSRFAEHCAQMRSESVCYVATAQALDEGMRARIERHRQQRPAHWRLQEEPLDLRALLESPTSELLLIDCLTLWTTNLLLQEESQGDETGLVKAHEALISAAASFHGDLIMVSNETNMGVLPVNALARRYCDEMGRLHQRLAELCDEVVLVVAGLPLYLKGGELKEASSC